MQKSRTILGMYVIILGRKVNYYYYFTQLTDRDGSYFLFYFLLTANGYENAYFYHWCHIP